MFRDPIRTVGALAGGFLMLAGSAHAVDGVIEISHACASSASGCTATGSDTGGYPVTIGQAGSYRLTSNLTVPANTGGIQIIPGTPGVISIDLNGFEIAGPATCGGCPVTSCTGGGSEKGIYSTGAVAGVSIRGGTIRGMGAGGIDITGGVETENVAVLQNGGSGIKATVGPAYLFRTAIDRNLADGLGVDTNFPAVVRDSVSSCNGHLGFAVGVSSLVKDNILLTNGGFGLQCGFGAGSGGNVLLNNNGGGSQISGSCAPLSTNLCNGAPC